jgi:paraquat-inducible protein A
MRHDKMTSSAGAHTAQPVADRLERLIACPVCDVVYTVPTVESQDRAVCARCHTVLIAPRRKAGKRLIALALTVLILIVAATVFPFLAIDARGLHRDASVLQTAFAFSGAMSVLSVAVLFFIVVIPATRLALLIYVLAPLIRDRPALVKLSDLADVVFGPAAWLFAALVVIVVVTDRLMCRYSIWKSLEN